jgi:hypothetical protein
LLVWKGDGMVLLWLSFGLLSLILGSSLMRLVVLPALHELRRIAAFEVPEVSVQQPVLLEVLSCIQAIKARMSKMMGDVMPRHKIVLLIGAALLTSISMLPVSNPANADAAADIRRAFLESHEQQPNVSVLEALNNVFRQFDPSGQGLTAESLAFAESVGQAAEHANFASHWLRFDLNADLKVERAEVEAQLTNTRFARLNDNLPEAQKKRQLDRMTKSVDQMFKGDSDGNGVIEGQELYNSPQPDRQNRSWNTMGIGFAKSILAADPNGDGVVTESEATGLVAGALQGVEKDIAALATEKQQRQQLGMGDKCPKLDVAKDTRFVVFGAHGGSSLSTVSVAGQDESTHAANVFIEDGAEPITLMLTNLQPLIWKFSGATQRISKVILAGQSRRNEDGTHGKLQVGAVGIDKSKVVFLDTGGCFKSFYKTDSAETIKAKVIIENLADRPVDVMLGQYEPTVAALPSGEGLRPQNDGQDDDVAAALVARAGAEHFTVGETGKLVPLRRGASSSPTESDLLQYNPFGLMVFKPEEIVTEAKAEAYSVLPEHAGLLQLQGEGKIEFVPGNRGMWKVKAQIRYPAGLGGALSTSFFISKGVPVPEGNPGHSCVFSEQKAKNLTDDMLC